MVLLKDCRTRSAQPRIVGTQVLSPDNKAPGSGRNAYLRKREELWLGGANLVEIDLLRTGLPTVRVDHERLQSLDPWHYLVAVTRLFPSRYELYPFRLEARLPRIGVPLAADDRDVALDLQQAFTRCWEAGPYPELLRYAGLPPVDMTEEERAFCRARLAAKP